MQIEKIKVDNVAGTVEQLKEWFDEFEAEYLEFDKVEVKRSSRADLHAFLFLDELFPSNKNIIDAASHDQICLRIDLEELVLKITKKQVCELRQSGIILDDYCLSMFI